MNRIIAVVILLVVSSGCYKYTELPEVSEQALRIEAGGVSPGGFVVKLWESDEDWTVVHNVTVAGDSLWGKVDGNRFAIATDDILRLEVRKPDVMQNIALGVGGGLALGLIALQIDSDR